MNNRAERRYQAKLARRACRHFPLTLTAFRLDDPAGNERKLNAIDADYREMLARPGLSAAERAELETGAEKMKRARRFVAELERAFLPAEALN